MAKELESHPKRPIHTVMPGGAPHLEPVVIAGVAFYLDHENELVVPIEPAALPADPSTILSKSNSKASLSRVGSKMTSAVITPNIILSPRKVSFET